MLSKLQIDPKSMSSDDDDSFSKVGFSDVESVEAGDEKICSVKKQSIPADSTVIVQLPPNFVTGADTLAAKRDGVSLSSEASSFVPVKSFGKLKVAKNSSDEKEDPAARPKVKQQAPANNNRSVSETENKTFLYRNQKGYSSDSGWSVVSSLKRSECPDDASVSTAAASKAIDDDTASVANSSTISGFDLISLNGSCQKQCKLCSFLNKDCDTFCKGCDLPLVANPSLTADEKLAAYLQKQEEEEAFLDLLRKEKKRDWLGQQPVLFRAQTLANDILTVVKCCQLTMPYAKTVEAERTGFSALPQANLAVLASRFIDYVDEFGGQMYDSYQIKLCYCYTSKDACRMQQIRQDGFGPNFKFGSVPEATGRPGFRFRPGLRTIPENGGYGIGECQPHQGWIVAIVVNDRLDCQSVRVSSGSAEVFRRKKSYESLPLVSFDATLANEDIIRRLMNGLETTCHDFFYEASRRHDSEDSGDPKRCKVDLVEDGDGAVRSTKGDQDNDDEAFVRLMQESLYEEETEENESQAFFAPPPPITETPTSSFEPIKGVQGDSAFDAMIDSLLGSTTEATGTGGGNPSSYCGLFQKQPSKESLEPLSEAAKGSAANNAGDLADQIPKAFENSVYDLPNEESGSDLDGLVRVGSTADDARVHNLEAAAASMKEARASTEVSPKAAEAPPPPDAEPLDTRTSFLKMEARLPGSHSLSACLQWTEPAGSDSDGLARTFSDAALFEGFGAVPPSE